MGGRPINQPRQLADLEQAPPQKNCARLSIWLSNLLEDIFNLVE